MEKIYRTAYLFFIAFFFLCTGCKTQNLFMESELQEDPQFFKQRAGEDYQYQIRKGDKISVSLWDHDDMSVGSSYGIYNSNEVYGKWLMVDDSGLIVIPKLGKVQVLGNTVMQTEELLQNLYAKWVVEPIVDVKVLNKEVTVIGEFLHPGKYLVERDRVYLTDILAKAGDFDLYANRRKMKVIRMMGTQPKSITIDFTKADAMFSQNIQIRPGDIVYVPSRKGKIWDKRNGSTIVPITAIISSIVVVSQLLLYL